MNLLNNNTETETTAVKEPSKDLAALLAEYGQPAEVKANESVSSGQPTTNNNSTATENTGQTNPGNTTSNTIWQGNPAYFQTGKRAGQLRPQRKGPSIVYNASNTPASIGGDLITGAMFLALINLMMPVMIAAAHNFFEKKKEFKIKWSDIAITKEQENKLAPIADLAAKQIILTWSAPAVLIFSMLGLYIMQYMIARMEVKMKSDLKGIK